MSANDPARPSRRPNVLLITTDQQRYDALGVNGNRVLRTPNLDALAASGTNFSRCYVTCPVCIPARRTLISGLHPDTHGMQGYREGWEFDPPATLPGVLRAAGYQTTLVGKLHLHPQRKRFGFDHMTLSDSGNYRPTSQHQAHNDYLRYLAEHTVASAASSHGINGNGRVARPWHLDEDLHHSSWVAHSAAQFFDTVRDPSCPWFLHLSFVAPHPPLVPPKAYWDRYAQLPLTPTLGDWSPRGPGVHGLPPDAAAGPFSADEIRDAIAGYYALISHVDDRIAFVLDRFFEYGNPRSKEPTLIIFSSDHGEMLGDHHLFRKSLGYEASSHVPFFITGRNMTVPVGTCHALCGWEDVMPTILDLAGVPIPDGLDGRTLAPAMRHEAPGVREQIDGVCFDRAPTRFCVAGPYKYIWYARTHEEQLFDVLADPAECHDLSGEASHRSVLMDMRARMTATLQRLTDDRKPLPYEPAKLTPCSNRPPAALAYCEARPT